MTPDMRYKVRQLLIKHENYKLFPYYDEFSKITIGIGRNLTDHGVSPTEIDIMFEHDVDYFYGKLLDTYDWFNLLNEARQIALIDMCFNLGFKKFQTFTNMIKACEIFDYDEVALQIIDSEYEKQVGQRAHDIAAIIRSGVLD